MAEENTYLAQNNLLFFFLLLTTGGLFTIGMLCYGEPFLFWEYPLSDLGRTVTEGGYPNTFSFLLFSLAMLICGSIMLAIGLNFKRSGTIPNMRIKKNLSYVAAAGYFIALFPHNISNPVHSVGSAMFVGSLWGLSIIFLLEARHQISPSKFYLLQLILQGTVITYAINFIFDTPIRQITQKFAVVGLMLVLKLSSRLVMKPVRERVLSLAREQ